MELEAIGPYTRKLAAILFTDMVGYTAVMQKNEMLAIQMQKKHQHTVDKYVQEYGGQVKNDMGDGSMSILPSAYQVIKCAMAIQTELKTEPRVNIRVGIHIADVLEEESGKIHGDGINIASRIETLGVAGAILFSKEIFNKIKNHPEFKIQLVGQFPFKNVEEPMEVYAIANEGFSIPTQEQAISAGKLKKDQKTGDTDNKSTRSRSKLLWLAVIPILGLIWYGISSNQSKLPADSKNETKVQIPINRIYQGIITSFDNKPVRGVIIDINGGVAKDTSDRDGKFSVTLPKSYENQQVTLSLFQNGKLNLSHEIRLSSPEVLSHLKLQPE